MSAPKRNDVKEETTENTRTSRRRLVPLNQKERQPGEQASSSQDNRRPGTPLPRRRDYPSRETSVDSNATGENTRRRERSMSYGREARQPFRDWASLITSEELERAKERIHLERKWDYSFMCALYKITDVVEQKNTLTVGTPEYQELIEGFGKLIAACVRHSILMHVEDASTNLAECVAVSKLKKKSLPYLRRRLTKSWSLRPSGPTLSSRPSLMQRVPRWRCEISTSFASCAAL